MIIRHNISFSDPALFSAVHTRKSAKKRRGTSRGAKNFMIIIYDKLFLLFLKNYYYDSR